MLPITKRFHSIVEEGFKSVFKRHGYRCKGLRCAQGDTIVRVAEIEKATWCYEDAVGFSVGLGVYVRGRATWSGWPEGEKPFPAAIQGAFRTDLDALNSEPNRHRYDLESKDRKAKEHDRLLIEQLAYEVECYAIPFLGRFQTIEDIIEYLEAVPNVHPIPSHPDFPFSRVFELASLYSLAGDERKSIEYLERAVQLVEAQGASYFIEAYRKLLQQKLRGPRVDQPGVQLECE